ncbi:MAG: antitoxin family protein [Candidatus Bipolaricaulota bacterium]|nr:antitoxin family protein [Candidatus Bipolaricaulota bacterium]
MAQTIEAIYENGILRPLKPLENLKEHSKVRVTIEAEVTTMHPFVTCIGILPDEDAAEMRRIIEEEFEKVDLREWQ